MQDCAPRIKRALDFGTDVLALALLHLGRWRYEDIDAVITDEFLASFGVVESVEL